MLIKSADDKSKDIQTLQTLSNHPEANAETKRRIEQELRFIQSGIKGEKEAAYEIEFHYGESKNWAVIHDLRIEHKGRVAQIDHLIINRLLEIWVCESKRFSEGVAINEHGEFSAFYGSKPHGIASPIEQNHKHCVVLQAICDSDAITLPKRLGFTLKPDIRSLVLVSKNARISRPKQKMAGLENIIKADQIKARVEESFEDQKNPLALAKVVAPETLEELSKQLKALHKPIQFDWYAKFGLSKDTLATKPIKEMPGTETVTEEAPDVIATEEKTSKLACGTCGTIVAYNVAKFCWFNKAKFGGKVYCMDCQKTLTASVSI